MRNELDYRASGSKHSYTADWKPFTTRSLFYLLALTAITRRCQAAMFGISSAMPGSGQAALPLLPIRRAAPGAVCARLPSHVTASVCALPGRCAKCANSAACLSTRLWPKAGLPAPGRRDKYGGWTMGIHQHWWGHRAAKATLLYIVGCEPADIPDMPPLRLDDPTHVVQGNGGRPHISKAEREHTPPDLARWLVELARSCKPYNVANNRIATAKTRQT